MNRRLLWLQDAWRNLWIGLGNLARRASRLPLDYDMVNLSGSLPEYLPPSPWWQRYIPIPGLQTQPGGPSLTGLRALLERIAADPRPRGVVLRLDQFAPPGWATVDSLRDSVRRLRESGKRVVAYSDEYSTISYYLAAAADEIMLAPGGAWNVLGLRIEATFLKDALEVIGVEVEVLNVSPYKTAGDTFSRADMSPEHREMLNWILDGQYNQIVGAMAAGRTLDPERVRALIDGAPKLAADALECGLVDAVCFLDELPERLAAGLPAGKLNASKPPPGRGAAGQPLTGRSHVRERPVAGLATWSEAHRALAQPVRWHSGQRIGVVALEGTIAPGASRRLPVPIPLPFVGQALAGSESVSQAMRRAEKDETVAAVVFYVDSRGGSAIDSSLIWREVERLRRKKPVVVYMANAAASGGYYVAAGANWIIAQPLTVTGSIGVVTMKFVIAGLLDRLRTRQLTLERGARAGLFSAGTPFGETGRPVVQGVLDELYRQFRQVVIEGRGLDEAGLEAIAGGRVWLGKQALERRLVDELGDFQLAVEKARELAQVPAGRWTPAVWISPGRGGRLPPPFPAETAAALVDTLMRLSARRAWMIAPVDLDFR